MHIRQAIPFPGLFKGNILRQHALSYGRHLSVNSPLRPAIPFDYFIPASFRLITLSTDCLLKLLNAGYMRLVAFFPPFNARQLPLIKRGFYEGNTDKPFYPCCSFDA